MALATLSIDLVAKLANLEAGFTKAQHLAQSNSEKMQSAFQGVKDIAIGIGAALAASFSARMFVDLVKGAIDAADRLNDLAKSTQLTVEQIGGIGFAASQAGSDLEGAAASMGKLNVALGKAAAGDAGMNDAFSKLGISLKNVDGSAKDAGAVLAEIADKFKGYADGPNKAALAQVIFGRSYQSMLPLLADGGAELLKNIDYFKQFGGVTTASAKAADEFNDTIGKLQLVMRGGLQSAVVAVLPSLQLVATRMTSITESASGIPAFGTIVRAVFNDIAIAGAKVALTLSQVILGAQAAIAIGSTIGKSGWFEWSKPAAEIGKIVGNYKAQFDAAGAEVDRFAASLLGAEAKAKALAASVRVGTEVGRNSASRRVGTELGRGGSGVSFGGQSEAPALTGTPKAAGAKGRAGPTIKTEAFTVEQSQGLKDALAAIASNDISTEAEKTTAAITELNSVFYGGAGDIDLYNRALKKLRGSQTEGPPEQFNGLADALAALKDNDVTAAERSTGAVTALDKAMAAGGISAELYSAALVKLRGTELVGPVEPPEVAAKRIADLETAAFFANANADATARWKAQLLDLEAATPTAKLAEMNDLMSRLADAYQAGRFGILGSIEAAKQYAEVVRTAVGGAAKELDATATAMDVFAKNAAKNIQSQLGDTIYNTFKGNTSDILSSWADMLQKMVAQALAADLTRKLFGASVEGGSGTGWLGLLMGLFSGASSTGGAGTISGGSGFKASASGGTMAPFSSSTVNERGPELLKMGGRDILMMGSQGGRVVPNSMLGGAQSNITFNIASGVSRNEVAAMIPALTAHIKAELQMTMRRPGFQRA